ncbi:hypothetical protein [Microbulbifer halophilus]|uniref:hypothetical protein n=1 Tax=Microbulbifer halophilus TaxID=453963 RepID=UPI00361C570D
MSDRIAGRNAHDGETCSGGGYAKNRELTGGIGRRIRWREGEPGSRGPYAG